MTIKTFIQREIIQPRLQKSGVLVVYDPDRRYRDLCQACASDECHVVDATESSIESREAGLRTLQELGNVDSKFKQLLIYVPTNRPQSDEEKQRDPFSIYGACGSVFPERDGDEYMNLCLKAKADYATEIRRIFQENLNPSFDVIDAVGGGGGWPNLQASLSVESARDILFALLAPKAEQKEQLKAQDAWVSEAKDLFQNCLGLKLVTRGKTWNAVGDELWRFLLFSEFVFDLPETLPPALANVPKANPEACPLIEDLCDRLRNDRRTQATYIERAEQVQADLNLTTVCQQILNLGVRDTFPFEERSFFRQAVDALARDDIDAVREILTRHTKSVWSGTGESQSQWILLRSAVSLVEACGDAERQLPENARSQESLIGFYLSSLREVDRLQREFEQASGDYIDAQAGLQAVVDQAQGAYRRLMESVQGLFVKHLETAGWPPTGRLANADVFDRLVAPCLQESGRRVAYLQVDALRYELGLTLEKQLQDDGQVSIQPAFAQLPTITPVGMASLLPGAGQKLTLTRKNDELVPCLGSKPLKTVKDRMDVFRDQYGQRFHEALLNDFLGKKFQLPESVDLFVIRTTSIDTHLESSPDTTLAVISDSLKRIRAAIHKLRDLGFQDAFIVTDHGFFLNAHAEAGDLCKKPPGNWISLHDRCLIGDGNADANNFVIPADRLGIRGDFTQVAGPKGMVAYRDGVGYFHGGASLQEAVVPVITVRLATATKPAKSLVTISMLYRQGAKKITTRLPVVTIKATASDLLSRQAEVELLLEACDASGKIVGEAKPGGLVNAATQTVLIKAGESLQITLKMDLEFEGKFTVKAMDPATFTTHAKLELETDYTV